MRLLVRLQSFEDICRANRLLRQLGHPTHAHRTWGVLINDYSLKFQRTCSG